jgi:hypothetical protein
VIPRPAGLPRAGERRPAPPDGPPAPAGLAAAPSVRTAALALLREALDGLPPSAGPWLRVESGDSPGRRLPLRGEQVLGRAPSAELRLPDPHLSRRHARVICTAGEVFLEDLGSRGGTLRNGRRLGSGRHALAPGDEIRAGATRLRLVPALPAGATGARSGAGPSCAGASRAGPSRAGTKGVAAGAAAVLLLAACALAAAALA